MWVVGQVKTLEARQQMEHKTRTALLVGAALTMQLMTAGCFGGGGGSIISGIGDFFSGFFGGSNSSSSGINGIGENIVVSLSEDASGDNGIPEVAVLHNPEPGSLMLFGSGLAGLSFIRRRRSRKKNA